MVPVADVGKSFSRVCSQMQSSRFTGKQGTQYQATLLSKLGSTK